MLRHLMLALAILLASPIAAALQGPLPPSDQYPLNDQLEPPREDPAAGDPVTLFNGNFHLEETDLTINGRGIDLNFTRTYRSGTVRESALGDGWDFIWNQFIVLEFGDPINPYPGPGKSAQTSGSSTPEGAGQGDDDPIGELRPVVAAWYYDGETGIHGYRPQTGTETGWKSPPGHFTKLKAVGGGPIYSVTPPTRFEMRTAKGHLYTFDVLHRVDSYVAGLIYRLTEIRDRSGNRLVFQYDTFGQGETTWGRLARVIDTYGRSVELNYTVGGLLESITDFAGRTIAFTHGGGNLLEVTTPSVVGTPTGNDFPQGKTTRYTYGAVHGKLETITAPQEAATSGPPYLVNEYNSGGSRVLRQVLGGTNASGIPAGGTHAFISNTATHDWGWFKEYRRVLAVDPNGNTSLCIFDKEGSNRLTYRFSGRLDPEPLNLAAPISSICSVNPASPDGSVDGLLGGTPALRPTDPKSWITKKTFNSDGLVTLYESDSEHIEYRYDASPDVFQHGNLLAEIRYPVPDPGGIEPIIRAYAYEPYFNQVRAEYDPRGLDPTYIPPNGGTATPERYSTLSIFDYQEGDTSTGSVSQIASDWFVDVNQSSQFAELSALGISLGTIASSDMLGDINGDGAHVAGNVIVEQRTVNVLADPSAVTPSFQTQTVEAVTRYNAYSLPYQTVDPEGNLTAYEYYPEDDPDGDGTVTVPPPGSGYNLSSTGGQGGGGYLSKRLLPEAVEEELAYDPLCRRVSITNGRGFTWQTVYNSLDQVVREIDARGYSRDLIYDANNDLVEERLERVDPEFDQVELPTGLEVTGAPIVNTFTYDLLGKLVVEDRQADASTRLVTRYRYDKTGGRVLELRPEWGNDASNVAGTLYDERGLAYQRMEGGLSPEFRNASAHDDIAEMSQVADSSDLAVEQIDYSAAGLVSRKLDGEGFERTVEYDSFNRPRIIEDPLEHQLHLEWDPAGQEVSRAAVQADATLLTHVRGGHDELGRRFQEDRLLEAIGAAIPTPDGPLSPGDGWATTRRRFDRKGNVLEESDDNQVVVTMTWDGLNRLSSRSDPVGNVTTFDYDAASNLIRAEEIEADPSGGQVGPFRTWAFYDELNRTTAVVNEVGHTERAFYDSRGNVVFRSDPNASAGALQLASLDAFAERTDLIALVINDHGNTTRIAWDDSNRQLSTTRYMRSGGVGGAAIDPTVAGDGRLITSATWDLNSRLSTQTDDDSRTTTYNYDSLDRLHETAFADGTAETLQRDRRSLVFLKTDANGSAITQVWDDAGRLVIRSVAPAQGVVGSLLETYQHDGLGRVVVAADEDSTVERVYDTLGRLLQDTQNGLSVTGVSDGVGLLKTLTLPGGRTSARAYDAANRLDTISDASLGGVAADYDWYGLNRLESRTIVANGTRMDLEYDQARRLIETRHVDSASGIPFDRHSYGLDRAGNKTSRTDELTDTDHVYAYDSSYQLRISERFLVGVSQQVVSYGIDGAGDRSVVMGGPNPGVYTQDPADEAVHQYTTTPSDSRTYDANGNLLTRSGTETIAYDARNRMVEVQDSSTGAVYTYSYDAFGRRISKTVDPGTGTATETRFVWWGWQVVEERDAQGVLEASYLYGAWLDERITMRRGGVDTFLHADDMGNVRCLTDSAGLVLERYEYGDYGQLLDPATFQPSLGSAYGNPYLFQGRRFDSETGLYEFRFRYMEPENGRFSTRDPIGVWGDRANFGNGYNFAGSNPWSARDPMGLKRVPGSPYSSSSGRVETDEEAWLRALQDELIKNQRPPTFHERHTSVGGYSGPPPGDPHEDDDDLEVEEQVDIVICILGLLGVPLVGELSDVLVLLDEDSTPEEEEVAEISLWLNALTLGMAPNFGRVPRVTKILSAQEAARRGARGNGLPGRGGPPGGTLVRDTGHGTGTIREYDGMGNARTDFDFHDGEAAGNPHAHDWDWSQTPPRGPARPLMPGE